MLMIKMMRRLVKVVMMLGDQGMERKAVRFSNMAVRFPIVGGVGQF